MNDESIFVWIALLCSRSQWVSGDNLQKAGRCGGDRHESALDKTIRCHDLALRALGHPQISYTVGGPRKRDVLGAGQGHWSTGKGRERVLS